MGRIAEDGARPAWGEYQGVLLNGCIVSWKCSHVHDTQQDAKTCAEQDLQRRGTFTSLLEKKP